MTKNRYLKYYILNDLKEKMVFIGGPRQVGKTTFSEKIITSQYKKSAYFNWDNRSDRKSIMASEWPGDAELIILDEIHKYKKWKRHIKGEYDKLKEKYHFLITGSARLDTYRKGGDSLQGRYHYYRMHPFSIAELNGIVNEIKPFEELIIPSDNHNEQQLEALFNFGGFPEPFLKHSKTVLRRWHNEKIERLFREDIRDIENIRNLDNMILLGDLLPAKVGSMLSINSLCSDIEASHRAVSSWLKILEAFYYQFRIYPFTGKRITSLKKESKLYLWDWSEINDENSKFENMVGSHLLKMVHLLKDAEGYKTDLYFIRNTQKKEIDFLVTVKEKPWFCVEVKMGNENPSPNLYYYKDRLNIPFLYQVIKKPGIDKFVKGVRVISANKFLNGLV